MSSIAQLGTLVRRMDVDLTGFIDSHLHAAPEHIPRLLDDIRIAEQAREAGMAGVLIKSHTTLTADRATIASTVVPGIRVWGGLVLNYAVGGLNPAAVETALAYGAAEIWMPTLDAANQRRFLGHEGLGLEFSRADARENIQAIFHLIASHDVILGTGHLSAVETFLLVGLARQAGVKKILITHPEAPFIDMPISMQRELATLGCRFERTWVFTTPALGQTMKPERMLHEIKEVGVASTILATDMGQIGNPPPVEGLRAYIQACSQAGFSMSQIRRMGADNIREWLS